MLEKFAPQKNAEPKVFFVDDSEDLRMLFIHLMKFRFKEDCKGCATLAQMLENKSEVLRAQIVVLDINLGVGEPSGIDCYDWLKRNKFAGKILFLTGHAKNHPTVKKAWQSGAQVYEKPVDSKQFTELLASKLREPLHGNA
jgi:FixJ family two-component response regulator